MINRHEFNSEWWGEEVGIVTNSDFFLHSAADQRLALTRFVWVEVAQPVSKLPDRRLMAKSGFVYTDTQIRFRIDLRRVQPNGCANSLQLEVASEHTFGVGDEELRPFPYERFYAVPGAAEARVNNRYVRWSNNLIRQHPSTCLRFHQDGRVQGWFLARPDSSSLELTLAMLSANSTSSGFDLYSRALAEYAKAGFRFGHASFSARNTPVHNIYANLGARFLEPRECWMWIRPSSSIEPMT